MSHFVQTLAAVSALAAALLAAMFGAFAEMPVTTIVLRAAVVGGLVFAFLRLGGDLAWRSLLRGLAEHQVSKEESESSGAGEPSERRKAA